MPQNNNANLDIAVLSFDLQTGDAVGAPKRVQLTPAGEFRSVDGRPAGAAWRMTAPLAMALIAKLAQKKTDLVIDYDHQSLYKESNGQPAIAAGWFKTVGFEDGKGLFADAVSWTPLATQRITDKEYRYISPVLVYDTSTGDVIGLHSVALTNTPGLDGLAPLNKSAALNAFLFPSQSSTAHHGGTSMTPEQIAALSAQNEASKAAVAALTTERDTLKTSVDALTAEKAKATADADKAEHTRVLAAALSGDKPLLTPAQKPWAEKLSLAALNEYLEATKPVLEGKRQSEGGAGTGVAALSQVEKDMCKRLGVAEEAFAKTKAGA